MHKTTKDVKLATSRVRDLDMLPDLLSDQEEEEVETHLPAPKPINFWDSLKAELTSTDFDERSHFKEQRISNFLNVPFQIEKVGYLI